MFNLREPSFPALLLSSPLLEAVVRVGDDDRPVVEVGGEDEWLHGPVHQGQGLGLPATRERVVAQVRVEPGEIYLQYLDLSIVSTNYTQ